VATLGSPFLEEERKCFYSDEHLMQLQEQFLTLVAQCNNLVLKYTYHPFENQRAREYAQHGFGRRIGTLSKSIRNLYEIIPPQTVEVPDRELLYDAQINIQACVANIYGSIDNLAWIWVYEKDLTLYWLTNTATSAARIYWETEAEISLELALDGDGGHSRRAVHPQRS
jgi:hypothetical protein